MLFFVEVRTIDARMGRSLPTPSHRSQQIWTPNDSFLKRPFENQPSSLPPVVRSPEAGRLGSVPAIRHIQTCFGFPTAHLRLGFLPPLIFR